MTSALRSWCVSEKKPSTSSLVWILAFHGPVALLLQTGDVNEETEVISLGIEQVPDVSLVL